MSIPSHLLLGVCLALLPSNGRALDWTGPLDQERWRLVPEVGFGGGKHVDADLTHVEDLDVARDGRIYVLQRQDNIVRVFDNQGRFDRVIGRSGDGPGEFRGASHSGFLGDTLWVTDSQLRRVTYFTLDGQVVRTVQIDATPLGPNRTYGVPMVVLAGESGLARGAATSAAATGGAVARVPLLRLEWRRGVADTLYWISVEHQLLVVRDPEGHWQSQTSQPLDDAPLWAVPRDGRKLIVLERPAATSPTAAEIRLVTLDMEGDTLGLVRHRYEPVPLTSEVAERLVAVFAEMLVGQRLSVNRARELVRKGFYRPRYIPPYSDLVAGRDGTLWARCHLQAGRGNTWDVFSEAGKLLATVGLPSRVRIFEADERNVWAVEYDDDNVPHGIRYRIERERA